jgi:rod shape-determining protein MreD
VVLAAGLVVIALLVDSAVLTRTSWPGATPELAPLVVVALALLGGSRQGATVGLAAGLLADLVPPHTGLVGLTAIGYGLAGAVAGRWHRPGQRSAVLALVAAGAATLAVAGVRALQGLVSGALRWSRLPVDVLAQVGWQVLLAALVVPLVVLLDRVVEADPPEVARL